MPEDHNNTEFLEVPSFEAIIFLIGFFLFCGTLIFYPPSI